MCFVQFHRKPHSKSDTSPIKQLLPLYVFWPGGEQYLLSSWQYHIAKFYLERLPGTQTNAYTFHQF